MKKGNQVISAVLGSVVLSLLSVPGAAAGNEWSDIDAEIASCVATLGDQASYDAAHYVRHAVVAVKERSVGYKLDIQTAVYGEAADTPIREYATTCVVHGSHAPMNLVVREIPRND